MVSGGLGSSTDTHSGIERPSISSNPRPYLAPPLGMNDYSKESKPNRIAGSPPVVPNFKSIRKSSNNSGATGPKRNAQKEKKEKTAPPVYV